MKLDNDTKNVMRILIEDKFFIPHFRSIDISKFLDVDRKIDLWLLEVAIRFTSKFLQHMRSGSTKFCIPTVGLYDYCVKRGIEFDSPQMQEEFNFFSDFIDSIIKDETSPGR
jgi:hypothetical protein